MEEFGRIATRRTESGPSETGDLRDGVPDKLGHTETRLVGSLSERNVDGRRR